MNLEQDKIFFNAGDVVTLKQDIPNKPVMIVVKKETSLFKHDNRRSEDRQPILKGIRCRWFTSTGELQESVWNTKDLIKINNYSNA